MPAITAADQIRILIATDSHVGYAERDPIRKDDAWKAFDEVMQLAKTQDVDMVLLAGDLFHENKPSRKAMYQVMRSLRMNCYGEKPCELMMLSDANDVFDGAFSHVNYEDQDINVAIPVFSIHGNHDDPSGDGHLCALDILQVSGLVNYFGKTPEADRISVKPILLQKGQTKLALYGLSNVRDERLFRTFRDGKVKFFRPGQQRDDWFNLMAVHQNHHSHTSTDYLPEDMLPEFLDMVVWGHEHECIIDPRKNPETGFHVMQPGSSVATSLVPSEAIPKHVAILTVTGKDFEMEKFPIKSVRPFITREIKLSEDKRFRGLEKLKDNKTQVSNILRKEVDDMIQEAVGGWRDLQDSEFEEDEIPKPLIRLKVECSSPEGHFVMENPIRFSNYFQEKVANVNDVVSFHWKKTGMTRKIEKGVKPEDSALLDMSIDDIKVDKLVHEYLEAQSLKILPQAPFGDAVTQFVDKDDNHALGIFVNETLTDQVKSMLDLEPDDDDDGDLDEAMQARREIMEKNFLEANKKGRKKKIVKYKPKPDNWDSEMEDEHWVDSAAALIVVDADEDVDDMGSPAPAPVKKAPAKRAPAKRAPAKTTKTPAKRTPAAKAPAKKTPAARGRKKTTPISEEEEEELLDDDDDVIMLDEEPAPKKAQPKRAAASRGAAATRQTQLAFSQPAKSTQKAAISDDEISDDDEAFAPAVSQQSSRRR